MIYDVINFLKRRLETHLSEGRPSSEPLLVLSNPWSGNDSNQHSTFLNAISLINVEEEKIFRSQTPSIVQKGNGQFYKKEPDLKLNLYIMVSTYHKNYEDGLKFLSRVVSFFQANSVFYADRGKTGQKYEMPDGVEKIITELYTAGFEQQNQIWAALSTAYIPSLVYKIRMIVIDQATAEEAVNPIKEITTNF